MEARSNLTKQERDELRELSRRTGRTERELVPKAVEDMNYPSASLSLRRNMLFRSRPRLGEGQSGI